MRGLILKDLLVVRKPMKTYILLLLFYFLLTLFGFFPMYMCLAMGQVLIMMLPVSTFSYDEQAHWDRFAGVLPMGRVKQVQARYLFTVLISLAVFLYNLVLSILLVIMGVAPILESVLMSLLASVAAGLLIVNLMLPLCYKMGPERARPYLFAIVLVPVLLVVGADKLGFLNGFSLATGEQAFYHFLVGMVGLMAGGFWISMLLSCRIVSRKEY